MGRGQALHVALGQGSLLKAHREPEWAGWQGAVGEGMAWEGRGAGRLQTLMGPGLELFVDLAPFPEGQGRPHASLLPNNT